MSKDLGLICEPDDTPRFQYGPQRGFGADIAAVEESRYSGIMLESRLKWGEIDSLDLDAVPLDAGKRDDVETVTDTVGVSVEPAISSTERIVRIGRFTLSLEVRKK